MKKLVYLTSTKGKTPEQLAQELYLVVKQRQATVKSKLKPKQRRAKPQDQK